jgi:hypothetical protein
MDVERAGLDSTRPATFFPDGGGPAARVRAAAVSRR